jgi:hypothetical protein
MKTIADGIPDDDKREYIRDNFKPGCVFYLLSRFPSRTKDKYLLLASALDPPLFLVINSKVPLFIQNRPRLSRCQVPLMAEDHPQVIEHDCFLDCTATLSITFEEVTKQAMTRMQRVKGRLSQATLQEVVTALERDHRIQLGQKLRMLEELKAVVKS